MSYKLYDAEIGYLESTGTQYIDTGITIVYATDVVEMSLNISITSGSTRQLNGANGALYFGVNASSKFEVSSAAAGTYNSNFHNWYLHCKAGSKVTGIIDGTSYQGGSVVGTVTYEFAIFLFALGGRDNAAASFFISQKLGNAVIRKNGAVVRDFIPVRVGNVGYLFDKVSGQLFGNSGTGSFVLGPDVAPAAYVNEVAFLESTGSQYIDTGIVGSSDLSVVLKCYYPASSSSLPNTGFLFGSRVDNNDRQYALIHSYVSNFRYGNGASNSWANPEGRVLIFDNTESHNILKVFDTDNNLVTTLTATAATFNNSLNIYLFGNNNNGTIGKTSNRIYSLKMYEGTTLVRDFIPVEYNNIGYLYDKVSGEFFANQGTGKFVLGHRAPRFDGKACARSYTRRQLMAKAPEEDWSKHYLTFKVLSAGTITVTASGGATGKTFQYSQDGGQTWLSITSTAEAQSLGDFTAGMNILVKSVNTTLGASDGANTFNGTARVNLCGNIMSLLYGDSFVGKTSVSAHYAFASLFKGYAGLISARHLILPVTSHGTYGGSSLYYAMFQNCTSLISGPKELPLLDGTNNCYASMFDGCISLESAPVVQLRTLHTYTGWYMFRNCRKLNYIKAMFTTAPVSGSTTRMREWVTGVATNGTFVKNSAATWDVRGVHGIPNNWTIQTADK